MCKTICVIGEDKRSQILRKMYKEDETKLFKYVSNYTDASFVIAPIPFSRDEIKICDTDISVDEYIFFLKKHSNLNNTLVTGGVTKNIKDKLEKNNIKVIDILEFEEFSIKNAIATVEGAISYAIQNTDYTLCQSKCLVLGYGRIGKLLCDRLKAFGCLVTCSARNKKDFAGIYSIGIEYINTYDIIKIIENIDIIINTIPHVVITDDIAKKIKSSAIYIELASSPFGIDEEIAKKNNINYIKALGLPSKTAPYSAACYIKEITDSIL